MQSHTHIRNNIPSRGHSLIEIRLGTDTLTTYGIQLCDEAIDMQSSVYQAAVSLVLQHSYMAVVQSLPVGNHK